MDDISKTVGGFRAAIQDLLVPELKAIQTELKHHSEEFAKIDKRFEGMTPQELAVTCSAVVLTFSSDSGGAQP